jgi:hypothetical protein
LNSISSKKSLTAVWNFLLEAISYMT